MKHDYDLRACLEYNPQSFPVEDVERVLAIHEGNNDEDNWRWVLQLTNGRFAYLTGWCDYTGWDCQSGAMSKVVETAEAAANCALEKEFAEYDERAVDIHPSLIRQLKEGVDETWRARMDKEFGIGWDTPIITPQTKDETGQGENDHLPPLLDEQWGDWNTDHRRDFD